MQLSLKLHIIPRKQTIDNPLSQPLACASEHHVVDIEQQDDGLRILVQDVETGIATTLREAKVDQRGVDLGVPAP